MRFSIIFYLFTICMNLCSQDRIGFIDSLDICKDEIEKLERLNLKKMQKCFPIYKQYSDLKQLHFFELLNKTNSPITKEEYLDYSFFKKMQFSRGRLIKSMSRYKQFLSAYTFVFTSDGKLVGAVRDGFVEDPNWMEVYNADELGRLVVENKISFAFRGGLRGRLYTCESWKNGGDMDCVVIDEKIFLLNNLDRSFLDTPDDPKFHLLPWDEFIGKKE